MLYHRQLTPEASPKAISGRTRYLRVCLAFHPLPQVIPSVFNRSGFGPPRGLTPASACPWQAHPASRLRHTTHAPCSDSLSLRLASSLTSPHTVTRWLILQKARRHPALRPSGLRLLVSTRFQVLFHSPPGVLFTFPSRYLCAIGHRRVFSLGGWSPRIHTGFHVSGITREPALAGAGVPRTGLSPSPAGLSRPFRYARAL